MSFAKSTILPLLVAAAALASPAHALSVDEVIKVGRAARLHAGRLQAVRVRQA